MAIIYATLTSIVFWTPYSGINPSIELVRVLPIAIVVLLAALLLAMQWLDWNRASDTKLIPSKTGLAGSMAGFFATGCPICQPIWLVWLGLGQASLFLIDLSVWISLVSIALLIYSLHAKLNENCQIGSKKRAHG